LSQGFPLGQIALAIDVGNTNTVLGLFQLGQRDPVATWRLTTYAQRTFDELGLLIEGLTSPLLARMGKSRIDLVVVASVVPAVTTELRALIARWPATRLVVVGPGVRTGVRLAVENPKEVGADRVANAVAVKADWPLPAVVVDLGTATTFDVVSSTGDYVGGVILPGVEVGLQALAGRAARLAEIELLAPTSVIGTTTVDSMRAGAFFGTAAMIDGLLAGIQTELGEHISVVATGGWAPAIAPFCRLVPSVDPLLTLRGLMSILGHNLDTPVPGASAADPADQPGTGCR
jgi:type III pantothenate kinase